MLIIRYLLIFGFAITTCLASSQTESEKEYLEAYNKRILQSRIDGVYIPVDIDDAFTELKNLSEPEGLQKFKLTPEDIVDSRLQGGIGRWMIINWGFYDGSRLSHHLKSLGVHHPEDMAGLLLVSFHRHLNALELNIADQISAYQAKRQAEHEEQMKRDSVIQVIKSPE